MSEPTARCVVCTTPRSAIYGLISMRTNGVFFLMDAANEEPSLKLLASYAYRERKLKLGPAAFSSEHIDRRHYLARLAIVADAHARIL